MAKIKVKQLQSGSQPFGQIIISDGSGNTIWSDISGVTYPLDRGTTFPSNPESGDLFYRTDLDIMFHYDDSRTKWLSITTNSYTSGRNTLASNVSGYFGTANTSFTSTEGIKMPMDGTIIKVTVDNANVVTRNVEFRVNNSTTNRIIASLSATKSIVIDNTNQNFSEGDYIQVGAMANGTTNTISNVVAVFEVSWRA